MSASVKQIARSVTAARNSNPENIAKELKTIKLQNLPRTVTPSDLRRLIRSIKIDHVAEVKIDYTRFRPTGTAFLKLTHHSFLGHSLDRLRRTQLSSHDIVANACDSLPTNYDGVQRLRGVRGREEAAERGLYHGNGPAALVNANGCGIVLSGLPQKLDEEGVKEWLLSVGLIQELPNGRPSCEVYRVPPEGKSQGFFSKHFVRVPSTSEAHRIVRLLHMTPFQREVFGSKYLVRACVVY